MRNLNLQPFLIPNLGSSTLYLSVVFHDVPMFTDYFTSKGPRVFLWPLYDNDRLTAAHCAPSQVWRMHGVLSKRVMEEPTLTKSRNSVPIAQYLLPH